MNILGFLLELLIVLLLAACGGGDDLSDKGQAQKSAAISGLVRPTSGVWWNPAESGRGYTIELQGNILVFYTYLFDVSGRASWYGGAAALNADGSFDAQLQEYTGGQSLTGPYKLPAVKGNVTSVHLACSTTTTCTLTWAGGTIPIQRMWYGNDAVAVNAPQSGLWWNPAENGRGYFVDLQGDIFAFYTYIFDASGNATWYMSAGKLNANGSYDGKLQEYSGGQSLTGSFKAPIVKGDVSSVHWACTSSTTCTMTWAGGTLPLQRFIFGYDPPQSTAQVALVNLPGVASSTITKQTDPTGATVNDKKVVSSEYLVQIKGADANGGSIRITIPINTALLPAGAGKPLISPEYFDTASKSWLPIGSFVVYDSATQTLSFTVAIADTSLLPVTAVLSPLRRTFGAGRWASSACTERTHGQVTAAHAPSSSSAAPTSSSTTTNPARTAETVFPPTGTASIPSKCPATSRFSTNPSTRRTANYNCSPTARATNCCQTSPFHRTYMWATSVGTAETARQADHCQFRRATLMTWLKCAMLLHMNWYTFTKGISSTSP